ncbi:hypothetical protein DRH14_02415 [Candidatus Shapirobacteria bacterium]|nr:MAG: hypothetical protein DRH14_02415 [Candidatus Shapirobacteria bacterium]
MTKDTRQLIKMILKMTTDKNSLFFWLFVRFLSAFFPLLSVYLFSSVIKLLENGQSVQFITKLSILILIVFIIDNLTRLISTTKLNFVINNIQSDIHNLLSTGIKTKKKSLRHKSVQAIRNFSDAVVATLTIFKQPGIDSFVSFFSIPIILFFLDFKVFILQLAYMLTYLWIDVYTTERYVVLKNKHNASLEAYYAKFQDSDHFKREQRQLNNCFKQLTSWAFTEWFTLQNSAKIFYTIILFYLLLTVHNSQHQISDLVLIMGYVTSTQAFLNSFSNIKDSLADTKVALKRLATSRNHLAIDFDDLV